MNRRHFCTAMGAMSLVLAVGPDAAAGQVHNVRSYGARGDGSTIDSPAINRAIEAAAAKGGVVYFPAGTYASYSVRLKSRITIYLDRGATLLGASGGYDAPGTGAGNDYQDFGHSHWRASLIWGEDLSDIKIIGPGRIDGSGLVPRMEANSPAGTGDKAIALKLCRDVHIEGVTIVAGGHIAVLATGVDHLTIDNVTIDTIRDGINVDSGRNIRITNTTVNSFNNDGICLKSSYALGHALATKNVTITNCRVSGYDVGTLVAGTYIRHAKDIRMHNVHMGFTRPDLRPPFVLDDVVDAQFRDIKADRAQGVPMVVRRAESQAPPA